MYLSLAEFHLETMEVIRILVTFIRNKFGVGSLGFVSKGNKFFIFIQHKTRWSFVWHHSFPSSIPGLYVRNIQWICFEIFNCWICIARVCSTYIQCHYKFKFLLSFRRHFAKMKDSENSSISLTYIFLRVYDYNEL